MADNELFQLKSKVKSLEDFKKASNNRHSVMVAAFFVNIASIIAFVYWFGGTVNIMKSSVEASGKNTVAIYDLKERVSLLELQTEDIKDINESLRDIIRFIRKEN